MNSAQLPPHQPVILFDGVCKFCHSSVQFVIRRDRSGQFLFCPIQSSTGQILMQTHGVENSGLTSMVLLHQNRVYRKSTAALHIARRLRMPWPLLYVFMVIPANVRDIVYDYIGNHRYQWFGKYDKCWIPDDETRSRFLE